MTPYINEYHTKFVGKAEKENFQEFFLIAVTVAWAVVVFVVGLVLNSYKHTRFPSFSLYTHVRKINTQLHSLYIYFSPKKVLQ